MSEAPVPVLPRGVERALWGLVALGALARIVRFLDARPLWADEATVALMVLDRSLADQLVTRAEDPVTPVGFLVATRLMAAAFGSGELALRALPFVAGLASLPTFHALVRRLVAPPVALVALALFAVCEPLVFYTSELKPYAGDVWIALTIALAGTYALERPCLRSVAATAVAGAVGVWLSLPAAFVIGSVGLALALRALRAPRAERRDRWGAALVVSLSGALSFGLCFATTIAPHRAHASREGWWGPFFPPLEPSLDALAWYPRSFFALFNDPLGLPLVGVAAALFAVGAFALARRGGDALLLALGPLGLAFLGAVARLAPFPTSLQYGLLDGYYPFFGRVLLFAVPGCLLAVAAGWGRLAGARERAVAGLGWLALAAILLAPIHVLVRNAVDPPVIQDMRTLARAMQEHAQPDDLLLTLGYAEPTVDYYALRAGLPRPAAALRLRKPSHVEPVVRALASIPPGTRFWLATVHHRHWPSRRECAALLPLLDRIAVPLVRLESFEGEAHLYRRHAGPAGG